MYINLYDKLSAAMRRPSKIGGDGAHELSASTAPHNRSRALVNYREASRSIISSVDCRAFGSFRTLGLFAHCHLRVFSD